MAAPKSPGKYQVNVALQYRKVDQFLLNYLFGETNQVTSPVTELATASATVRVKEKSLPPAPASPASPGRTEPQGN